MDAELQILHALCELPKIEAPNMETVFFPFCALELFWHSRESQED